MDAIRLSRHVLPAGLPQFWQCPVLDRQDVEGALPKQQAPMAAQVLGPQTVLAPWVVPPRRPQLSSEVTWQVPLPKQQAPVGQVVPLQRVPPPSQVPLRLTQLACIRSTHPPVPEQQAPLGWVQLALTHSTPSPR